MEEKVLVNTEDIGRGTILFVRKKVPGATVGEGYEIEVYENGVKQEVLFRKTKREVIEVLKEYKALYNTNRSFQNSEQVFVTYKTKEERGERKSMESLDNQLLKKATTIQSVLQHLLNPESPVITRLAENALDSQVIEERGPSSPPPDKSEEQVIQEAGDRIVEIIKTEISQHEAFCSDINVKTASVVDTLYNKIKKWLFEVKKNVDHYIQMGGQLDINKLFEYVNTKLFEGAQPNSLLVQVMTKDPGLEKDEKEKSPENTPAEQGAEPVAAANYTTDFLKYASTLTGSMDMEEAFSKWIVESNVDVSLISNIKKSIYDDIDKMMNKEAFIASDENFIRQNITSIFIPKFVEFVNRSTAGTEDELKQMFIPLYTDYVKKFIITHPNSKRLNYKQDIQTIQDPSQRNLAFQTAVRNAMNNLLSEAYVYADMINSESRTQIPRNNFKRWEAWRAVLIKNIPAWAKEVLTSLSQ